MPVAKREKRFSNDRAIFHLAYSHSPKITVHFRRKPDEVLWKTDLEFF